MDKISAFKVFSRSNPWLDVWQASVLGLVKEPGPRRAQACGGPDSTEPACCRSGQSISRAYDNRTMMPLAPTPIVPVPSKPKIGFSIDSIVGGGGQGRDDRLDRLERVEIERDDGSPMDVVEGSSSPRARRVTTRSPGAHSEGSDRPVSRSSSVESYPNSRRTPSHPGSHHHHHANHHGHHHHLSAATHLDFGRATVHSHSGGSTPNNSPSPPHRISHGDSPVGAHPQPPPGVVRPSPNYLAPPPGAATAAAVAAEQLKSLYGLPGHGPAGPQTGQTEYHTQQQLALAANLAAAQHFQAANLAVALQAHHGASPHGPPHGPYPHGGAPGGPHPPPHPHQPPRDSYPLYPWLLSRHGRIFPHRFPGGTFIHLFLFFSSLLFSLSFFCSFGGKGEGEGEEEEGGEGREGGKAGVDQAGHCFVFLGTVDSGSLIIRIRIIGIVVTGLFFDLS